MSSASPTDPGRTAPYRRDLPSVAELQLLKHPRVISLSATDDDTQVTSFELAELPG